LREIQVNIFTSNVLVLTILSLPQCRK